MKRYLLAALVLVTLVGFFEGLAIGYNWAWDEGWYDRDIIADRDRDELWNVVHERDIKMKQLQDHITVLEEREPEIITKTVIKEVTVTEYITLPPVVKMARQFNDVREMIDWVNDNRLPIILIADSNGEINLNGQPSNPLYDCDDYAGELQRRALKDGYIINVELDKENGLPHALNSVIIGNDWYFIEPQDGTYWFKTGLD